MSVSLGEILDFDGTNVLSNDFFSLSVRLCHFLSTYYATGLGLKIHEGSVRIYSACQISKCQSANFKYFGTRFTLLTENLWS